MVLGQAALRKSVFPGECVDGISNVAETAICLWRRMWEGSAHMCVCVRTCVHVCTCMHVSVCVSLMRTHDYVYVYMCPCVCICVCAVSMFRVNV